MSEQVDIAALRELMKKATGESIGSVLDWSFEPDRRYVVVLLNAAPALLDALEQARALRSEVSVVLAERDALKAEVERLRAASTTTPPHSASGEQQPQE